jgi:hypothetical protein
MKLSATFINANGDTKPFDITEGFSLQDAFNVVANDDFAPTQINIQSENMNLPSYSLGSEQPVETAYDILGKYSTADIIAKHKISQQQLEPLLEEGANHELEHTSNILVAMKIAQDHLYEHLDYYKRLKQAKLAKGAVIEAVQNRNKYEEGGRSSFPIYTRMKNQIDKLSVMEFLRKYPQVESVMNQYVRTPNVKAGYLMFLSEKDMNDQNLEDWGATVKGTMTLPNGTKIKRYNWDFGNAEGFAEVFQYLYDKQNGYAKGGKVGADTSDKMVADAKGMSKQNYLNKYSVDITESYMDAKKQYEGHHKTDYPVTLGMFVDSLHTEYKALGGVTNTNFNNRYDKGGMIAPNGKPSNLSPQQYELVRTPEFKAWFGDWENDPNNASKVVDENGEPMVVYRGDTETSKKGFVFKKGFNQIGYINNNRLPNQYFHYFVNIYDVALGYAKSVIENHNDKVYYTGKGKIWNPKVTPYFLNIRNPIDITPNNPLFPTFQQYLNAQKKLVSKEYFEHDKYMYPYFYGSNLLNRDLYKIFQDKLGQNYLEDRFIKQDDIEYYFLRDNTLKDSFLFFIEFNYNVWKDTLMSNMLNKTVRTMLDNNVDGLLFLEMTNWEGEFYKNWKKYESGELKYDYRRWKEMPKIYAALESNQIKLADGTNTTFDSNNPDIRFDNGGYVSEDILIDNNIDKIDDIYVLTEDDKPVKSLGQFTFKGFGKYVMQDLAAELYDDYKIRLRSDFAIMLGEDVIKPSIKVAQMKGDKIELLAIIYNALVTDEKPLAYVYNEDGEMVDKFTDEDEAEEMVNDNDGYYSEVRVEEVTTTETILAMEFDFQKHEMTFVSSLLDKKNTHKFKYGGKL